MPGKRSAMKALRTSEKARVRHKSRKSAIKTLEKKLRTGETGSEDAANILKECFSKLDKAVKCGTIHRNKADRKKGQLAKLVNSTKKK